MKNLDCNHIKIFVNLEIIGEEDKDNICICIYINLTKFLQCGAQPQLQNLTFII